MFGCSNGKDSLTSPRKWIIKNKILLYLFSTDRIPTFEYKFLPMRNVTAVVHKASNDLILPELTNSNHKQVGQENMMQMWRSHMYFYYCAVIELYRE